VRRPPPRCTTLRAAVVQPVGHELPGAAFHHVEEPGRAAAGRREVDQPSREPGVGGRRGGQERGLVHASRVTAVCSHCWSRIFRPYSVTARMIVGQPTPRSLATCATLAASWPTRRQACTRARSVRTAFGRIASVRSDQVPCRHSGSRHRHTRSGPRTADTPSARLRSPPAARPRLRTRSPRGPGTPAAQAAAPSHATRRRAGTAARQRSTVRPHLGPPRRARGRTRIVRPQARLPRQTQDRVATRLTTHGVEEPVIRRRGPPRTVRQTQTV